MTTPARPRDETFCHLFKEECRTRGLSWYYTEVSGYGFVSFAPKDTRLDKFLSVSVNVAMGKEDMWFTAYTGLMKWVTSQEVRELPTAGDILQVIVDYGPVVENDWKRVALEVCNRMMGNQDDDVMR